MTNNNPRIAVIGAGPAGLAAGHELLRQGFTHFTIFEKSEAAGGTWHSHSYPGLECDLWAHSYTFSYRPNPDWTANFVGAREIEGYLQQCAREFGLEQHFVFNTNIVRAEFQPDKTWVIGTASGATHSFDVIINAMGGQHTPVYPQVEGMDSFRGDQWHSTYWNHDVDLQGKRVVVVGSAAAAVQIVPRVAEWASHLTVLQRTPNWIMPRNKKVYAESTRKWFHRVPALLRIHRRVQGMMMSVVLEGVTLEHKRMQQFEDRVHQFIAESIADPKLRELVTPDTPYGCKRGLVSDDYYTSLTRDNVELIAEGVQAVRPDGITTASGREIDADVIIYCTGYRILDFDRIDVIGAGGKSLTTTMEQAPVAYKGIAAPGFPNYFFSAGPNGLAINVSYFTNIERNVKTIVNLLTEKQRSGIQAIAVKPDITDAYNRQLAGQFEKYSWGSSSCNSYYRTATGHAPFLYPGSFKDYARQHENCTLQDFEAV